MITLALASATSHSTMLPITRSMTPSSTWESASSTSDRSGICARRRRRRPAPQVTTPEPPVLDEELDEFGLCAYDSPTEVVSDEDSDFGSEDEGGYGSERETNTEQDIPLSEGHDNASARDGGLVAAVKDLVLRRAANVKANTLSKRLDKCFDRDVELARKHEVAAGSRANLDDVSNT